MRDIRLGVVVAWWALVPAFPPGAPPGLEDLAINVRPRREMPQKW
jgi:hypothetical protein